MTKKKGHPKAALHIQVVIGSALLRTMRLTRFAIIAALLAIVIAARLLRLLAAAMVVHAALLASVVTLLVSHDSLLSMDCAS
jgi:hypothetical protein